LLRIAKIAALKRQDEAKERNMKFVERQKQILTMFTQPGQPQVGNAFTLKKGPEILLRQPNDKAVIEEEKSNSFNER